MEREVQRLVLGEWTDLLRWIPLDLDQLATTSGAIQRWRAVRSGSTFLRLCLGYSLLDLSLRSTAAWYAGLGFEPLSDVAVLKRLRAAPDFLARVLEQLLNRQLHQPIQAPGLKRVRIIDGTTVSEPGSTGADWRIHLGYDAQRGMIDSVVLTDGKGAEHLGRAQVEPGDLVLGDRCYARSERLADLVSLGAHGLVRIGHFSMKLWSPKGDPFDPLTFASDCGDAETSTRWVAGTDIVFRAKDGREFQARLVVVKKSPEATERERRNLRKEAKRRGTQPLQRTFDAAAFTFILSTLPKGQVEDQVLADLYRVRWQVELAFKRLKSILDLGALRAKDPDLARTYIYGKLIAAVLAETIAKSEELFPPWGYPLGVGA